MPKINYGNNKDSTWFYWGCNSFYFDLEFCKSKKENKPVSLTSRIQITNSPRLWSSCRRNHHNI